LLKLKLIFTVEKWYMYMQTREKYSTLTLYLRKCWFELVSSIQHTKQPGSIVVEHTKYSALNDIQ